MVTDICIIEEKSYRIFDMFYKEWALVTAGNMQAFNSCTVGWGSFGTLWSTPKLNRHTITVYLYPTRYTCDFFRESETFTVSFFPKEYKKALAIMGSKSGRDCDKVKEAGLTPKPIGQSVTYEEADLTFLCRKLYQHQMTKEDIAPDIQEQYANTPEGYPVDENGDWHPHWIFIGEIIDVIDKRKGSAT